MWKSFINFLRPPFASYNLGCVICLVICSMVFLCASENVSFTLSVTHTDWIFPACLSNSPINRNNYTCMYRITIVFTRFFRWTLFWAILTYLRTYLLTCLLTYSMEQSPSWVANWFSASQEIPRILLTPKVHYHIHKCPLPVPILSQFNPVHAPTSHFLKIHLIMFFPSTSGSSKWSLSSFFTKTLYTPLLSSIRATCPAYLILLDLITRKILG